MGDGTEMNRLGTETSPYLLQHAQNPVHWQPWDEAALEAAKQADKPILLSIGYAACHWCHVMAHESFEDTDTAELMNRLYVNVKVDREERPDLDRIYQLAHQIVAQRGGGWPLTLMLSPGDLVPFFAGTYFPREPRYGMPAFREVLQRAAQFYRENRYELSKQSAELIGVFQRAASETVGGDAELNAEPIGTALGTLLKLFDPRDGGFGRAPKFPHTPDIELLLNITAGAEVDPETRRTCRHMATLSLRRMATGGIYDQLGGGFCRYSVDNSWSIPHFEKMLYDNGSLLFLYAQAWQLGGESLFRETADGTAGWAMREMQHPEGGYYSSLDADSEGEEGKFYVWTRDEVREVMSEEEFITFAAHYGLNDPPNFEETQWHLRVTLDQARLIPPPRLDADTLALLDSSRTKLSEARMKRIRPGLDDKVLTAWNGLMIRGMAAAGRLLSRPAYVDSAERAAGFIHKHLWRDGRLYASWRDGQARIPAFLDDHAFLLAGLLDLLQSRWDGVWFAWAREIADAMLEHFEDAERGGFWFTAADQATPLHRPKGFSDESMPSGNAVAARALIEMGHLSADPAYIDAGERALKAASGVMDEYPESHAGMLLALTVMLQPPTLVVLRGDHEALAEWRAELASQYDPRRLVLCIPEQARNLPGLLARCTPRGPACAYVCRGTSCSLPITSIESLSRALNE
jgi:hypothetical protein